MISEFYMLLGMRERTWEKTTSNSCSRICQLPPVMMCDTLPFIGQRESVSFDCSACLGRFPVVLLSFLKCVDAASGYGSNERYTRMKYNISFWQY